MLLCCCWYVHINMLESQTTACSSLFDEEAGHSPQYYCTACCTVYQDSLKNKLMTYCSPVDLEFSDRKCDVFKWLACICCTFPFPASLIPLDCRVVAPFLNEIVFLHPVLRILSVFLTCNMLLLIVLYILYTEGTEPEACESVWHRLACQNLQYCPLNVCALLLATSIGKWGRQVIPANVWPPQRWLSPSTTTGWESWSYWWTY